VRPRACRLLDLSLAPRLGRACKETNKKKVKVKKKDKKKRGKTKKKKEKKKKKEG